MTIGDRIRRIRKKRRLTQAELAMMSGLSLSAIRGYEQGRFEPKRKPLESIAEVFKIPVDELCDMPTQLGTNLASLGTDCISREQAIKATWQDTGYTDPFNVMTAIRDRIQQLPPIQPEIVRCKDCKYAEYINDVQTLWCTECGQGRTVAPNDFCSYAERREVTT